MTGFTGIVWDARTTERLVADLSAGVGPAPLAEAGISWAALAAELADIGAQYAAVLARLGVHWQSTHAPTALEHLAELVTWFADTAADATANASRAEAQAAANTVARLAMPNSAEVDLTEHLRDLAVSVSAVAPVLTGAAAHAERALHDQRMRAARVMDTYEHATEPVAAPWHPARPSPLIVSDAALRAEQAAARSAAQPSVAPAAPTPTPASAAPIPGLPFAAFSAPPAAKSVYAPTVLASSARPAPLIPGQPTPSVPASDPTLPPPVHPGAAMTERTPARQQSGADASASGHCADGTSDSLAGAPEAAPSTWADVVTTHSPVVRHGPELEEGSATLDPAYLEQTLRLGAGGAR
ncbi:PPE domain-containing protein [Gordonia sp. NPDC003425]